jgi:hypothetical protein
MHMTQMLIGTAAIAGFLQVGVSLVIPAVKPPPIAVHSLTYHDGAIVQRRTVATDGPFLAAWRAEIRDATTGEVVPGCQGSGVWRYQSGTIEAKIPIAEWVGSAACMLPPGRYQPVAQYEAGTFSTAIRGDVFRVE